MNLTTLVKVYFHPTTFSVKQNSVRLINRKYFLILVLIKRLQYQLLKTNAGWIEEICNLSVTVRHQEKLKKGEFTGRERAEDSGALTYTV